MVSSSPTEQPAMLDSTSAPQPRRWRRVDWRWLLPLLLVPVVWPVQLPRTATAESTVETTQALTVTTARLTADTAYTVERAYTGEIVAR
ncbi:MAG: hypothetical protein AAFU71_09830, partial [Cyanobacteria bacterium J06632_22]